MSLQDLLPPELRERFEAVRILGQGGFGRVLEAEDRELSRTVAIKLLLQEKVDSEVRGRFEREAHATSRLKHPNVVEVYDFGTGADGVRWIVYEFVEGVDLKHRLRRKPRPDAATIREWGADLAEALAHAHAQGILHRDVKPANILMVDGVPRLCDFGMARVLGGEYTATQTGKILGTPAYLAPEVFTGRPYSEAGDQYGLAATLYEALYGLFPQDENRITDLFEGKMPPPAKIPIGRAGEDPGLEATLLRALQPEPGQRFRSLSDMAAALRDREAVPNIVPGDSLQQDPRRPRGSGAPLVALLALLVLGGLLLPDPGPEPSPSPTPSENRRAGDDEAMAERARELETRLDAFRDDHGTWKDGRLPLARATHLFDIDELILDPLNPLRTRRLLEASAAWLEALSPEQRRDLAREEGSLFERMRLTIEHLCGDLDNLANHEFALEKVDLRDLSDVADKPARADARTEEYRDVFADFSARLSRLGPERGGEIFTLEHMAGHYAHPERAEEFARQIMRRLPETDERWLLQRLAEMLERLSRLLRGDSNLSREFRHGFVDTCLAGIRKHPGRTYEPLRSRLQRAASRLAMGHAVYVSPAPGPERLGEVDRVLDMLETMARAGGSRIYLFELRTDLAQMLRARERGLAANAEVLLPQADRIRALMRELPLQRFDD